MTRFIRYILWGVVLLAIQTTLVRLFSVENVLPDIVTIWLVYVALKEGQIAGTISGFISGLLIDFVSGDFLGLSALTKTLCGFIAGFFYDEFKTNQIFGTYRFFFAVLISSLLHNVVYFAVYLFGTDITLVAAVLHYGVGTTAYTSAVSLIPMRRRKK
ncbi:MAG: rod shape-determining protein MreD [Ignavibacteriales bacterium]|nr:rod shape-determining protein MreD [Ignavibacteriales bacterium]